MIFMGPTYDEPGLAEYKTPLFALPSAKFESWASFHHLKNPIHVSLQNTANRFYQHVSMQNAETHPHSKNMNQRTYFNNSQFGRRETIRKHKRKKRKTLRQQIRGVSFGVRYFSYNFSAPKRDTKQESESGFDPNRDWDWDSRKTVLSWSEKRVNLWRDETCRERSRPEHRHFAGEWNRRDLLRERPSWREKEWESFRERKEVYGLCVEAFETFPLSLFFGCCRCV